MSDWEISLIDQIDSVEDLRRRESCWQYELNTFQPNGLDECDVAPFRCVYLLNLLIFFIFSGLTYYIYGSTFIFTIIICDVIIFRFTFIAIFNIVIIILLFCLLISFKIYLLYFFISYLFIDKWTYSARRESFW